MNIKDIPVEELIQLINDNIDTNYFPVGQIAEVEDEEQWDKVADYIGGAELVKLLRKGVPERAKYFAVDTELNTIYWFTSKRAILDTIGTETIQLYLDNMM